MSLHVPAVLRILHGKSYCEALGGKDRVHRFALESARFLLEVVLHILHDMNSKVHLKEFPEF